MKAVTWNLKKKGVCARLLVWACVSCRDHCVSAASLISLCHGTCLNSKTGPERTSCPPGEPLRLPSTHSGHSSHQPHLDKYNVTPRSRLGGTALRPLSLLEEMLRWGLCLLVHVCICTCVFAYFLYVHACVRRERDRRWEREGTHLTMQLFQENVGQKVTWFPQVAKGKPLPWIYHKYLFPLNYALGKHISLLHSKTYCYKYIRTPTWG